MIEFAQDVQLLFQAGWTFTHQYGEERLSIPDKMIWRKGDRVCDDMYQIMAEIRDENERRALREMGTMKGTG